MKSKMRLFFLISICFAFVTNTAFGQDADPSEGQPNVFGSIAVEFGINRFNDTPNNMDTRIWGSRGIGIHYLGAFQLENSNFSFHPGIGLSIDKFSFKNDITINDTSGTNDLAIENLSFNNIKKTQLTAHYLDVPLELRYYFKDNAQQEGFMLALGGKFGVRYHSGTKIKYEEGGENVKLKRKESLGLQWYRYSAHFRAGWHGIHLFGQYGFSPVFQEGTFAEENGTGYYKVGLGISLF